MELILWRHAEAEEGKNDLKRQLSEKGRQQAKNMANWLQHQLPKKYQLWSSQALRSQQTAAYLKRSVNIVPLLNPSSRAVDLPRLLQREDDDRFLLWVGHQPWLGQLCAYLLNGRWDKQQYWSVKKSAIWWFELKFDAQYNPHAKLKVVLTPSYLAKN